MNLFKFQSLFKIRKTQVNPKCMYVKQLITTDVVGSTPAQSEEYTIMW
jgi:hypothetical protein